MFILFYCVGGIFNGSTLLSTTVMVDYAMSTPPDLLGSEYDSYPNQFLCWMLKDKLNKRSTTHGTARGCVSLVVHQCTMYSVCE